MPQGSGEEGWPEPGLCHVREGTIGREVGATFFRAAQAMHGVQFDFYLCEREGAHQITPQNSPWTSMTPLKALASVPSSRPRC